MSNTRHFKHGVGYKLEGFRTIRKNDIVIKNPRGLYRWANDDEIGKPVKYNPYGVYRLEENDKA